VEVGCKSRLLRCLIPVGLAEAGDDVAAMPAIPGRTVPAVRSVPGRAMMAAMRSIPGGAVPAGMLRSGLCRRYHADAETEQKSQGHDHRLELHFHFSFSLLLRYLERDAVFGIGLTFVGTLPWRFRFIALPCVGHFAL
jgi:hypothetical protein